MEKLWLTTLLCYNLPSILAETHVEINFNPNSANLAHGLPRNLIIKGIKLVGQKCESGTNFMEQKHGSHNIMLRMRYEMCNYFKNFDEHDIKANNITAIPFFVEELLQEKILKENIILEGGNPQDNEMFQAGSMRAISDCGPDEGDECGNFLPLEYIWNYGCWCYFGQDATQGQGPIMDQLDGICRDLQHCYRCAKIDSWNNGGEICVPGEQDYNIATNKQLSNTDKQILLDCRKENKGDDCAIHTCCCETQFLNKLLTLFFNGFQFDKNNYDRKKWNYQNVCIRDGRPAVLDCCGFYPNRKPFSLDNENVDCCNNHILYNPKFMKCCLSGEMVGANQSCSKNRIYSYRDFKKGKNKRRRRRR